MLYTLYMLTTSIHYTCYSTVHVYVVNHYCVIVCGLFEC